MSAPASMGKGPGIQPSVPPDQPALVLLSAMQEGAALLSCTGEVLYANERYMGLPATVRESVAAHARAAVGRAPERRHAAPAAAQVEVEHPGEAWHEVWLAPVASGATSQVAVVVRDVTAQHRRRATLSKIDRVGGELLKFDAQQIQQMNASERLTLLAERFTRLAQDVLHFESFSVWVLAEKTGRLECVIRHRVPAEVADFELYAGLEGNGIIGHVAATGESYVCEDADSDPLFMPGATGARCSLTVPLKLADRVIGVVDAESTRSHAFSEEDRLYAERFASSMALALNMLNLLVVERSSTNISTCGRVQGEIREPLDDILSEAERLLSESPNMDAPTRGHVERIKSDVEAIRTRLTNVASGAQTILGVDRAMEVRELDPVLTGRRVLIADDESRIRRVLGDVLRHRGCIVMVCENGQEAIDAIERATGGDESFDLIISDIKMPDRNGYEVFSAVRRSSSDVPVILMTGFGYDPHHSIVRASEEGLQAVLFKPFQIERMLDEVRKALTLRAL
ncbi:MAG: response regulator [Phycisphaeraceae bacterium]|nr:response regulator [Phycisphaeraceae bacterium]MCW5754019.1 response regulator [Phycisphaeraceae bacterium]